MGSGGRAYTGLEWGAKETELLSWKGRHPMRQLVWKLGLTVF